MEVDRREKSVEQSTNAILNPSARSENTFFVNCPVSEVEKYVHNNNRYIYIFHIFYLRHPFAHLLWWLQSWVNLGFLDSIHQYTCMIICVATRRPTETTNT